MSMGTAPDDTSSFATKNSATTAAGIKSDLESEAGLVYIEDTNWFVTARPERVTKDSGSQYTVDYRWVQWMLSRAFSIARGARKVSCFSALQLTFASQLMMDLQQAGGLQRVKHDTDSAAAAAIVGKPNSDGAAARSARSSSLKP